MKSRAPRPPSSDVPEPTHRCPLSPLLPPVGCPLPLPLIRPATPTTASAPSPASSTPLIPLSHLRLKTELPPHPSSDLPDLAPRPSTAGPSLFASTSGKNGEVFDQSPMRTDVRIRPNPPLQAALAVAQAPVGRLRLPQTSLLFPYQFPSFNPQHARLLPLLAATKRRPPLQPKPPLSALPSALRLSRCVYALGTRPKSCQAPPLSSSYRRHLLLIVLEVEMCKNPCPCGLSCCTVVTECRVGRWAASSPRCYSLQCQARTHAKCPYECPREALTK